MLEQCIREIPSIIFFGLSQRPCLEWGVATILYQYLVTELLTNSQVRIEFLQFDFDKSLTKEIDIKNIKCFSYVSCIYDTFWWIGIVNEVNVHQGDLKIEFLHTHGPRKTFSWPPVVNKCFVPVANILWMYWISDTYDNLKM